MALSSQTKTLLSVCSCLILVFLLWNRMSAPVKNEGNLVTDSEHILPLSDDTRDAVREAGESVKSALGEVGDSIRSTVGEAHESREDARSAVEGAEESVHAARSAVHADASAQPVPDDEMMAMYEQDSAVPESAWLRNKFNSRNKAKRGYKRSSYSGARRGSLGPSEWDAYFDHNNNIIGNAQIGDNDKFLPLDESNGGFAVFKSGGRATCGSNQNCQPEDLFDVDKFLPQEVNDDWFEVQPEPISVKNRHLINITKPIGINTIGTSLKNASYDIRGAPACPKFVVSPWLQSNIEADVNLKPMY